MGSNKKLLATATADGPHVNFASMQSHRAPDHSLAVPGGMGAPVPGKIHSPELDSSEAGGVKCESTRLERRGLALDGEALAPEWAL